MGVVLDILAIIIVAMLILSILTAAAVTLVVHFGAANVIAGFVMLMILWAILRVVSFHV